MLVSGPNSRSDYHIEEHEEYFYQIRGRLTLKIHHNNEFYNVILNGGDTFCLPANIPHSPQREKDSLGIVVERRREKGDIDWMRWYCRNESCRKVLWEKGFYCGDLKKDLEKVTDEYWADAEKRTCGDCGWFETKDDG